MDFRYGFDLNDKGFGENRFDIGKCDEGVCVAQTLERGIIGYEVFFEREEEAYDFVIKRMRSMKKTMKEYNLDYDYER